MNDYVHISILEETNSNSRRVYTHTHTCTWRIIIWIDWLICACALDEGQERILLAILLNYTREEFNLIERRECTYIEKKRKERVLIAARGRKYTREVCVYVYMSVSSAAFVCWFVPVIELDRRHFLLLTGFLILHIERSQIINYQHHRRSFIKKKSTFNSTYFYYSYY
jgi:hypothetical protein